MWDDIFPERVQVQREQEFHCGHWNTMLDQGFATARFLNSPESAWSIIDLIVEHPLHDPLQIQREMVELQRRFPEEEPAPRPSCKSGGNASQH
jgi:hypothetical protein